MNSFSLKYYQIATFYILITKTYVIRGARYVTLCRFFLYTSLNIRTTVTLSIIIQIKQTVAEIKADD